MNTLKNSLQTGERDLQEEVAGVLVHGHYGKREWRVVAWRKSLVLWASKAKCHLTPYPLPQPKRAGGEGVGLERWVKITRLEAAWAFGCAGAMDLLNGMDFMDGVDWVDALVARDRKDLRDERDQEHFHKCCSAAEAVFLA